VKYTLDSSVLVDAIRTPGGYEALGDFMSWARGDVYLSSVVVAELEAGARSPASRERLDERFLAPFERREHVVAPTASEWRRAGRVLGEFDASAVRESGDPGSPVPHLNDALLAVQARNQGWVVITRDGGFGELTAKVPGLRVLRPFPVRPQG
jgi:predicted nucleic acid-binding protein